ncbi:MAG: imidazole glycerol phosphate synthase subunit HisH [Clostridia bacterium]|nr:imidazole glycerol phosphate synthase subunit HisH [Clostridia bacterium]
MIAVIDYGVGNLFSLACSLKAIGSDSVVTSDKKVIADADGIILPGVGAFGDAALKLRESGLGDIVREEAAKGKKLLGICLGMQLLFEKSYEYGCHEGLGLLKGSVRPLSELITGKLLIPHMGWNALEIAKDSPILRETRNGAFMYFVHSYAAVPEDDSLAAFCDYGGKITAAVSKDNVFGCQFHPEKSGREGLAILDAFVKTKI